MAEAGNERDLSKGRKNEIPACQIHEGMSWSLLLWIILQ